MIDSSLEAVKRGMEYAKKVAESFRDIGEIADQIAGISEQLSENVTVQKHSLGNIAGQAQDLKEISGRFRLREE